MKEKLIEELLRNNDQKLVAFLEDELVAIGKEINKNKCLFYEFNTGRFYLEIDGDEYYIDDLLDVIFKALKQ